MPGYPNVEKLKHGVTEYVPSLVTVWSIFCARMRSEGKHPSILNALKHCSGWTLTTLVAAPIMARNGV